MHELVRNTDSDDRPDQGVRARRGEPEIPSAEVPDDGGDQKREYHGEPRFAADLQNQFYGQERNDSESHQARGGEHTEEIPEARPHYRDMRLQRMGVDHGGHGIGGVVKPIHKLEAQRDQQRNAQEQYGMIDPLCTAERSDSRW